MKIVGPNTNTCWLTKENHKTGCDNCKVVGGAK